ncbi:unnamed protein product [Spirodela intermedia]|uniref:PPC domain-containing protein n=1 Tax=Spirodela intermedia TaxID=51605 RepID=A0A7I8IAG1_SPIIN|nr:unnamed protein product [Spirodela intermedia]CAA6654022.1 unnamed protein product [Spirodela intermedia]
MAEYDGSATISLSRTPRATDSEDEDGPRRTISLASGGAAGVGGGNGDSPATGSALSAPRKPRGRPPGSKNKPKPPVVITRESESAMRPVVLELAAGADVLECVSGFARQRRVGVSIISGSGAVTNVTLRHPASHPTSLTLHGRFDILSLAGTFLPTKLSSPSSSPAPVVKSPFTVSLAGAQGQVIGGAVTGNLIAAGPVVLLVATFGAPSSIGYQLPVPKRRRGIRQQE